MRSQPNLVEMHRLFSRGIVFAVLNPGAGGHALELPGGDNRAVAHTVFVFQAPLQDVGDDLHIAVGMHPEPLPWNNPVFINDPQSPKAHVPWVVIATKAERMVGVEPTVVYVATLGSFSDAYHP